MNAGGRSHKRLGGLRVAVKTAANAFPQWQEEITGFRSVNGVVFGPLRVLIVVINNGQPSLESIRTTKALGGSSSVGVSVFARRDISTRYGTLMKK